MALNQLALDQKAIQKLKNKSLHNHFLVWNDNPVKICILVLYIMKKLNKLFELDNFVISRGASEDTTVAGVAEKYSKLANLIIANCDSTMEVDQIFRDKCLNGYEVIDLLAYEELDSILANPVVGLIINDFWKGPFYRSTFLSSSTCYQILSTNVVKFKPFYGYLPDKVA